MQKKLNKVPIVLTGGHAATTAIATIEEMLRRKKEIWDIYWIGIKYAIEGKKVPTLEFQAFPDMGITFKPIIAGRLQRRFSLWTIPAIAKIPFGFFHSLYLLLRIKPKLILSFGSFAAFPVVFVGWMLRIPVIVHEQTTVAGRANKFSAFFATKIALARESSRKYFPKNKVVFTGNPIMTQIEEIQPKLELGTPPTIFVMGGSRGSTYINSLIEGLIEVLLKDHVVIHQTGHVDYKKFSEIKGKLKDGLVNNYEVYNTIDPMQIDGVYKRADLVISRAGANTVSEIIVAKIPSIVIPIPWSYKNEQVKNAEFARDWGIAKIFEQNGNEPQKLLELIRQMFIDWEKIVNDVNKKDSPDAKAAQKLVDLVEETVK